MQNAPSQMFAGVLSSVFEQWIHWCAKQTEFDECEIFFFGFYFSGIAMNSVYLFLVCVCYVNWLYELYIALQINGLVSIW